MKIPFSIEYRPQIESGEYKVETKAGCPVRIVCWDMACELPILGLVLLNDEKAEEMAVGFTNEGTNLFGEPLYDKLFIVTPEPEMSEFEHSVTNFIKSILNLPKDKDGCHMTADIVNTIDKYAPELLEAAKDQLRKDGFIVEKHNELFDKCAKNIDNKLLTTMQVEYGCHVLVRNGHRHAELGWEQFQKAAQKFYDMGKAEALKDLPRWRRWGIGACGNGQGIPIAIVKRWLNDYELVDALGIQGEQYIMLSDLEKLPKED